MAPLQPNPWVATLAPYVPGRARAEGVRKIVKLSANESSVGASPRAAEAVARSAESLHLYPDGSAAALRRDIAEAHGLDADRIVCGAGSDELLHLVAQAFVRPGEEIVHSRHGFLMYPIIARIVGANPVAVPNRDWAADVDGILAAVTEKTRLVYLDNPNNPTGACLPRSEVERLIAGLPEDCILVYDAAYAECVDAADYTDGLDLAGRHENVFVTRTFSKLYGLAALRVGWSYGSAALIDPINRIRNPFNVSTAAQAAARAALGDREHLGRARAHAIEWRGWLAERLTGLGLAVVPSQTNFVLIEFPDETAGSADAANAFLTERGYLLRRLPDLDRCLRLTVGHAEENRGVVEALDSFLARTD